MSGHVAHTRERRGICRVLFGKPEKERHHMEESILKCIFKKDSDGVDWIDLAHV